MSVQSPSYNQIRDACLPAVERRLTRFLQKSARDGLRWNAEMSQYQFSTGGKRLRALIPCWVYAACGQDPLQAVDLGCALEMAHNATLVHDDLQDGDTLRRGMPTVWRKYGDAQSINCGDAMFHFALELLLQLPLDPGQLQKMALRFLRGINRVIEGQAQEFLLKEEDTPTVSRYIEVVSGKTAALVATSLAIAVESLGRNPTLCEALDQTGMALGIIFQMQDDLLDVYGDKGRDTRATDIAEGKISVLIAQLVEDATPVDRARTLEIIRKPREQTTEAEIHEVIGLFDRYHTRQKVISRILELKATIQNQPWRTAEPDLHSATLEMCDLFLKPIRHLLEEKA